MELLKGNKLISLDSSPYAELQDFSDRDIAFVLGIDHAGMHSLCVTESGTLLVSRRKPASLCHQLERNWQLYLLGTRIETVEAWKKILKQATDAVKPSLAQFPSPLRVATCGTRSFWSPNPTNEAGLWFFTPTCHHIQVKGEHVEFTTKYRGHTTHWAARMGAGVALPVSQARVDLLREFVDRKAEATQRFALTLIGQLLFDQGIHLKQYPRAQTTPQFPLSKWFFEHDRDLVMTLIFGRSGGESGDFIEMLYDAQVKKDEKRRKK